MTISDVLLDGNSHLRHISTMGDGQGGGWGLKFEEVGRRHLFIFFYLGFLSRTSTNHRTAGEIGAISLTTHYHFHSLHRHLNISREIAAERSPLHIAGSRGRPGILWFPSASR